MKRARIFISIIGLATLTYLALTVAYLAAWEGLDVRWSALLDPPTWRVSADHLLWPSMAASRMGLSYTWPTTVLAVFVLATVTRRVAIRLTRHRLMIVSTTFFLYALAGWAYVWVIPVPRPICPSGGTDSGYLDPTEYFGSFADYYREGLLNINIIRDGNFSAARSWGMADGTLAGVGERDRIAPGLIASSTRDWLRTYGPKPH